MIEQTPALKEPEKLQAIITRISDLRDTYRGIQVTEGELAGVMYLLSLIEYYVNKDLEKPFEGTVSKNLISCRKGCAFCCNQEVACSTDEAKLLIEYCQEEGIDIDLEYIKKQKDFTQKDWLTAENSACVFLNENNECKVYEARPAVCRKYLVMTPPEQCDTKKYPSGRVGVFGMLDAEVVASVFPNLEDKGELFNLPGRLYGLLTSDKQKE